MIIKAPQVYWSPCPTTPTMRAKPVCQPSALSQGQYSINISHFYATKSIKIFIFINFSINISQGQYKDFLWLSYHFTRSSNKSPGRSWLSLRTGFLKRTWRPRRKQRKEPKTLRWVRYVDTKWRRCVSSGIFFPNLISTFNFNIIYLKRAKTFLIQGYEERYGSQSRGCWLKSNLAKW